MTTTAKTIPSAHVADPMAKPMPPTLQLVPLANAIAAVGAVAFTLCALFVIVAPYAFLAITQTWFHGLAVAQLWPGKPQIQVGDFALGLVTFTAATWIVVAAAT